MIKENPQIKKGGMELGRDHGFSSRALAQHGQAPGSLPGSSEENLDLHTPFRNGSFDMAELTEGPCNLTITKASGSSSPVPSCHCQPQNHRT